MAKKKDKVNEFIVSFGSEIIGNRFMVKLSKMDNGVTPESFLLTTLDLREGGFSMKFFKTQEEVALFLKLLTLASK